MVTVGLRLLAVAVLFFGPWTDSAAELQGWDIERFHEIASSKGKAYVDYEVEYPPGSAIVFDALSRVTGAAGVVAMHRVLLVITLMADLTIAALLRFIAGSRPAKTYLVLGLPLVPMGFLRLDLVAAFFALAAFAALTASDPDQHVPGHKIPQDHPDLLNRPTLAKSKSGPEGALKSPFFSSLVFAVSISAGTMVKIWPALIVGAGLALQRLRHTVAAAVVLAICGVGWLAFVGDGLSPIWQVISLRGATGWHVESTPGSFVSLLSSSEPRLELNAFRIGSIRPSLVLAGRLLSLALMAGLIGLGYRRSVLLPQTRERALETASTVTLGLVASLLITAPLLSPQFILWLTPWAALLSASKLPAAEMNASSEYDVLFNGRSHGRVLVYMTAAIAFLTGATLFGFGPAGVAATIPAALLVIRNLLLIGLIAMCFRSLLSSQELPPDRPTLRPTGDSLG